MQYVKTPHLSPGDPCKKETKAAHQYSALSSAGQSPHTARSLGKKTYCTESPRDKARPPFLLLLALSAITLEFEIIGRFMHVVPAAYHLYMLRLPHRV